MTLHCLLAEKTKQTFCTRRPGGGFVTAAGGEWSHVNERTGDGRRTDEEGRDKDALCVA